MKMQLEFNSNEELLSFVNMFGGASLAPLGQSTTTENVKATVNTKEKEKPVQEPVKDKEVVKETPKVEAEVVKVETSTTEPVQEVEKAEKVITMEEVRAVFTRLIKAGKQSDAKKITLEFGANKLTELKEKDYAAAIEKVEALL